MIADQDQETRGYGGIARQLESGRQSDSTIAILKATPISTGSTF